MGGTQSEKEQADFQTQLHGLSCEILRIRYLNRPVVFDWYYNDYLYTDVRFLALMVDDCAEAKWMFPYEFWTISMGPIIQSRHYFRIRYHNGFYVLFDDEEPRSSIVWIRELKSCYGMIMKQNRLWKEFALFVKIRGFYYRRDL